MIQEYLLLDDSERNKIKTYKPDGIKVKLFSAGNEKCWYVQFFAEGENEKVARQLSDADEYVRSNYKVTVIESECSAYFNKKLYPLISKFEYKLRKLLYLSSAINVNNAQVSNVHELEQMDFGTLFTLLFIDNAFVDEIKSKIKARNRDSFSKKEIVTLINCIEENTLWDALLGKNIVPTLRSRFQDVKLYRNDVMHSHLISWRQYKAIKKLYHTINFEIDKALRKIECTESGLPHNPTFNNILTNALKMQEQIAKMTETLIPNLEQIQNLTNFYASNLEIEELQEALKLYRPTLFAEEMQEQLRKIATIKLDIPPAMQKLQEISQNLKTSTIAVPSEIVELQKSLAGMSIASETLNADDNNIAVTDNNTQNGDSKTDD